MKKEHFLIFNFPTNVMFVDDNQRFLKSIRYKIDKDQSYILYDDPEKALLYLQNEYKPNPNIGKFSVDVEAFDSSQTHAAFNLDVSHIVQQVQDAHRFDEISVLITDYAMPTMDGIKFCKQVNHLPIKKILVTGQADETLAVDAFNDGHIDKFILKNNPNFDEVLKTYIRELKQEYFYELTKKAMEILHCDENFCFNTTSLIQTFQDVLKEKRIVEHYLLDTTGSFLLLDENAKPYWFIPQCEEDRRMYLDFATDNEAPESLISELEEGKKLVYLWNIDDAADIRGKDWDSIAYPAKKLPNSSICYALIENLKNSKINVSKLNSYSNYLENHSAGL